MAKVQRARESYFGGGRAQAEVRRQLRISANLAQNAATSSARTIGNAGMTVAERKARMKSIQENKATATKYRKSASKEYSKSRYQKYKSIATASGQKMADVAGAPH